MNGKRKLHSTAPNGREMDGVECERRGGRSKENISGKGDGTEPS